MNLARQRVHAWRRDQAARDFILFFLVFCVSREIFACFLCVCVREIRNMCCSDLHRYTYG
jgi:hypothetical protein